MPNDIMELNYTQKEVGICLSGGGALGFAHVGVLQLLEEKGITPTQIAGSSMGTIIGTLYAAGISPQHMLEMIKDQKLYKITKLMTFRPSFLKSGLSSHQMLSELIKEVVPSNSFSSLKRQLNICVTNLNTSSWQIVNSGDNLDQWVAASASIPGLFETIKIGNSYYVDGGVLNNMPAQAIAGKCKFIIGVDVLPTVVPKELSKPSDSVAFAVRAMEHQNSLAGRQLCDFLIEPRALEQYHEFSFDSYHAIFEIGYTAALNFVDTHPALLEI